MMLSGRGIAWMVGPLSQLGPGLGCRSRQGRVTLIRAQRYSVSTQNTIIVHFRISCSSLCFCSPGQTGLLSGFRCFYATGFASDSLTMFRLLLCGMSCIAKFWARRYPQAPKTKSNYNIVVHILAHKRHDPRVSPCLHSPMLESLQPIHSTEQRTRIPEHEGQHRHEARTLEASHKQRHFHGKTQKNSTTFIFQGMGALPACKRLGHGK